MCPHKLTQGKAKNHQQTELNIFTKKELTLELSIVASSRLIQLGIFWNSGVFLRYVASQAAAAVTLHLLKYHNIKIFSLFIRLVHLDVEVRSEE